MHLYLLSKQVTDMHGSILENQNYMKQVWSAYIRVKSSTGNWNFGKGKKLNQHVH